MILKELRLSRHLSQEQLAQISWLNVRTIQRIESGQKGSAESLKCLAAVFEVDISTLNQENFMIDKNSENWRKLPLWLKGWFLFNFLDFRPKRETSKRMEFISNISGFVFCVLGLISEAALVGGLFLILTTYLFCFLTWQGDKYNIWYELPAENRT